jgi:hypothetical protein
VYKILKTAEIDNAKVTLFLVCRSVDQILWAELQKTRQRRRATAE